MRSPKTNAAKPRHGNPPSTDKRRKTVEGPAPTPAKSRIQATETPASKLIDQRIRDLEGWRGVTLARMRALILEADPEIVEEWKWMGTPVWSHNGIVCTGEAYKKVVKLTFAKGAALPDPSHLFNSSLEGNTRRAIDIQEGEKVDASAFKALIKAAVAKNTAKTKPGWTKAKEASPKAKPAKATAKEAPAKGKPAKVKEAPAKAKEAPAKAKPVSLLSGGNPQIAKSDGDAPVQAYIAAMPDWKRDIGRALDALVVRSVPNVRKAVKWNSPFYGIEDQGWFLAIHAFTHYVKVTFFRGASLKPVPPGASKGKDVRYLDIRENDKLNKTQLASWLKQAAALPGWSP